MADIQSAAPVTLCMSKVTLAAGTTTTLNNTGTTTYAIMGRAYTKAAMANAATPTTDASTGFAFIPIPIPLTTQGLPPGVPGGAAGYGCIYIVGFDSAQAVKVVQGDIAPTDAAGNFIYAPNPPTGLPNDFCPIGFLIVKLGPTAVATWTFGTNNNSSVTGATYTFGDLVSLPGRPLTS